MAAIVGYSILIVIASLCGGLVPGWLRLRARTMQGLIALVGGLMLGVAVLHLLPHSVAEGGSLNLSVGAMLAGLLIMFFLVRVVHLHHHEPPAPEPEAAGHHDAKHDHDHDHGGCSHGHDHDDVPLASKSRWAWVGLFLGLSLHTIIDGLALAAAVAAENHVTPAPWLPGLGVFLAVFLHKPLDALSIASLLTAGKWDPKTRKLVNLIFALMCPLGALLFWFGVDQLTTLRQTVLAGSLGFAAGVFLTLALADLLPELPFAGKHRVTLSVALLSGVVLAILVGFLEPEHSHDIKSPGGHDAHGHDHDHDHAGHVH